MMKAEDISSVVENPPVLSGNMFGFVCLPVPPLDRELLATLATRSCKRSEYLIQKGIGHIGTVQKGEKIKKVSRVMIGEKRGRSCM